MRAKEIMTTAVVTVSPETPLKEVARLLVEHGIGAVPVVDPAGDLLGIVSDADLVTLETTPDPRSRVLPVPHRTERLPHVAADVMTREVVALPEESDVSQVARLMLEKRIRQIPIVSGTRVTGIVARRDILRVLARSDSEIRVEIEELLDDELLMLGRFGVQVRGGVVTLLGSVDRGGRRLAEVLTRSVPGVLDVDFVEVNP